MLNLNSLRDHVISKPRRHYRNREIVLDEYFCGYVPISLRFLLILLDGSFGSDFPIAGIEIVVAQPKPEPKPRRFVKVKLYLLKIINHHNCRLLYYR